MRGLVDKYAFGARVLPVIVGTIPAFLAFSAWIPFSEWPIKLVGGSSVLVIAAFALSHLARDAGKSVEKPLWAKWGGPPTARMLRHSDKTFEPLTKLRFHADLIKLGAVETMPSEAGEQQNPEKADEQYRACGDWLRRKALEHKGVSPFDVVHSENIGYGYLRNLLGIKKFSLALTVGASLVIALAWHFGKHPTLETALAAVAFIYFVFGVTEAQLKSAADNYSHRLLSAIGAVPSGNVRRASKKGAQDVI